MDINTLKSDIAQFIVEAMKDNPDIMLNTDVSLVYKWAKNDRVHLEEQKLPF